MKNVLLIVVLMICLAGGLAVFFYRPLQSSKLSDLPALSPQQAMAIALDTHEAEAFLALDDGRFAACLQRRVIRPCDSGWVTCIDDAWLVEFIAEEACGVVHDGRLSLRLLVDKDGRILSRFPETEYFTDPGFCLEDYDCLFVTDGEQALCRNFIHGQMKGNIESKGSCECIARECLEGSSE